MHLKDLNILVPVELGGGSRGAIKVAVDLIRAAGGQLTLLYVGVDPREEWSAAGASLDPAFRTMLDRVLGDQRRALSELVRAEVPADVSCDALVREGDPARVIVAEAAGRDIVVMGTHGRTGLRRMALGSVTERVLRGATVPVMVTH